MDVLQDLATGILQSLNSLLEHEFPRQDQKYGPLREIQTIAGQYIPPLSLDAVNGAQVADENAPKGAHMNDNLIPVRMFRAWLQETPEGAALDKTLPFDTEPHGLDTSQLPFLVGEGTGMYEPLGYDNPVQEAMQYVYSMPSLGNAFKKPITHAKNETSRFFIGSLTGMTDYFFKRGTHMGTFWYCTKDPVTGALTRGARYADMIRGGVNRVAIQMHPAIPRDVYTVMNEATKIRVPPNDLILTKEPEEQHAQNQYLDQLVSSVSEMGRTPGAPHNKVPVYMRPYHLSSRLIGQMTREIETQRPRIWKVTYDLEHVTDDVYGYKVCFYVQ
jgi:hypothetical protein